MSFLFQFSDPAAPPRPPLPSDGFHNQVPLRPPPPPTLDTTDDESEDLFQTTPTASQGPIMVLDTFFLYYASLIYVFLDGRS